MGSRVLKCPVLAQARRRRRMERRRKAAVDILRGRGARHPRKLSATDICAVLRSAGITGELR